MTNDLRGGVLKRTVALSPIYRSTHKVINDVKNVYTLALADLYTIEGKELHPPGF